MTPVNKYSEWDTEHLIFNLIDEQHTFIKARLNNIEEVAQSLKMALGTENGELKEFWSRLDLFILTLQLHIMKEESSLYPDILRLSTIVHMPEEFPDYKEKFIDYQVGSLKAEHERVKSELNYFRTGISNFISPSKTIYLFTYLSEQFKELELALFRHLNIEDRVLYPRAIRLEAEMNDWSENMRNKKPGFKN